MSGRLGFDVSFQAKKGAPQARPLDPAEPFRILVLGDFSGGVPAGRGGSTDRPSDRRVVAVDVDSFDAALKRYAPHVRLALDEPAGAMTEIEFESLDAFHPDSLYRRLGIFLALEQTRRRLLDPATAAEAASELGGQAPQPDESNDDTLKRLLGAPPSIANPSVPSAAREPVDISGLLRSIVAPYIRPDASASAHRHLVSAVDLATSERMRRVLHDPAFQEIEGLWRSIHDLVTQLETGEGLELYLLDVTKEELAAEIRSAGSEPGRSPVLGQILEPRGGDASRGPHSVLACAYSFGPSSEDLGLLGALGSMAARVGAVLLGEAAPRLLGVRSFAELRDPSTWNGRSGEELERWRTLRRQPGARSVGLAAPRILLRLPYGKKTDPIESFEFEEMGHGHHHDAFLWGSPALGCALLLARSFLQNGWSMEPGDDLTLEDLPSYSYEVEGEKKLLPCAEAYLSERVVDALLREGLMPWVSHAGRNIARLARFQSVADPPAALAGPWA